MFTRIFFTFMVFGILGLIFHTIYFGKIEDKSGAAIVADVARGIGYKTEQAASNFWGRIFLSLHNVDKELRR